MGDTLRELTHPENLELKAETIGSFLSDMVKARSSYLSTLGYYQPEDY
jgi:hypothetical protein